MKIIHALSALSLCALCLCGDASAQKALKVGITPNRQPLIYEEAGQYAGLEADLAFKLGQELGREIEFVRVDWMDQIPALVEGRTDIIMSGMTITQKRMMQIAFSSPYFVFGQIGLVRTTDKNGYLTAYYVNSPKSRIGVEKGTTGEIVVREILKGRKLSSFDSPEQAVAALRKKRIDMFVHDSPVIWSLLSKDYTNEFSASQGTLSTEYLGWGMRRSDEQLLADVNRILEQWKVDGELAATVKKWMPFLDAVE